MNMLYSWRRKIIMRTFELKDKLFLKAEKEAKEIGILKNSIEKGRGNKSGIIGQYIARKVHGGAIEKRRPELYDYDLLLDDGTRVEVKTKRTTVTPKPFYEGSVTKVNDSQRCDIYVFCRVDEKNKIGWYMGYIERDEFLKKSRYMKKGEIDPRNNYKVKKTCWNIDYSELKIGV